jgi:HTH-type transcriptional regulator/antitoxin HigA
MKQVVTETRVITIRPIKSEADYRWSLERIAGLMDAEPDTPEGDELDVLATLVETWEERHHPIAALDPVEFLKGAMEAMGKDQTELAELLNSRPRASEILNRQRPLTLKQIRTIAAAWNLPTDLLVQDYELSPRP